MMVLGLGAPPLTSRSVGSLYPVIVLRFRLDAAFGYRNHSSRYPRWTASLQYSAVYSGMCQQSLIQTPCRPASVTSSVRVSASKTCSFRTERVAPIPQPCQSCPIPSHPLAQPNVRLRPRANVVIAISGVSPCRNIRPPIRGSCTVARNLRPIGRTLTLSMIVSDVVAIIGTTRPRLSPAPNLTPATPPLRH